MGCRGEESERCWRVVARFGWETRRGPCGGHHIDAATNVVCVVSGEPLDKLYHRRVCPAAAVCSHDTCSLFSKKDSRTLLTLYIAVIP